MFFTIAPDIRSKSLIMPVESNAPYKSLPTPARALLTDSTTLIAVCHALAKAFALWTPSEFALSFLSLATVRVAAPAEDAIALKAAAILSSRTNASSETALLSSRANFAAACATLVKLLCKFVSAPSFFTRPIADAKDFSPSANSGNLV